MDCLVVVLLVIPSLMVFLQASAQSEVEEPWRDTVFVLKPEENLEASAKVTLVYDGRHLSHNFTLCLWLWPLYTKTTTRLFQVSDATTFIIVKALEGRIIIALNTKCPVPFIHKPLLTNTWQLMCLVVANDTVRIHFRNKTFRESVAQRVDCSVPGGTSDNITVEVGAETDNFAYSGKVTGVRYYTRHLNHSEVKGLQNCEDSAEDFVSITNVSVSGIVSTYTLAQQEQCLPEAKEFVALFNICGDHFRAHNICTNIGGRLIKSDDNLEEFAKDIKLSLDVPEPDLTMMLWTQNMTTQEHGLVMSVNRESGTYVMLSYSCHALFTVTACVMPLGKTVYQKGDCTEAMTLYNYNRRLVLLPEHGGIIRREECSQPDHDDADGEQIRCFTKRIPGLQEKKALLGREDDIFGRNTWIEEGQNDLDFSITVCEEDQFTCDDGVCIPLQSRCDGVQDCEDKSDEGDKCTLLKPLPPSYLTASCPEPQPVVKLLVNVMRMHSVSLETNEFKANLKVSVSWRDSRLTFQNLQKRNQWGDSDDYSDIWKPQLSFPNAHYEDNLAVQTTTSVLEEVTVLAVARGRPTTDSSYEVMSFNGSEVEIQRLIQYQFTFSCDFDFRTFPFDTQACGMMVKLKPTLGCSPHWDKGPDGVQVKSKGSTLSMYSISPARYIVQNKKVNVRLLFTRKSGAYLMTTFLPCIILCLLAHVTITHFPLESFNDRIMVTLSLLIVLAALFSQLSSTLPSSPVSKLVDYFFFYCIVRVSLIFLLHSFIEVSLRSTRNPEEGAQAIINGNDPTFGIKMKLAWVSGGDEATKEPTTRKANMPRIINRVGCVGLLVVDVVVAALLSFMAFKDYDQKNTDFLKCNITTTNEEYKE